LGGCLLPAAFGTFQTEEAQIVWATFSTVQICNDFDKENGLGSGLTDFSCPMIPKPEKCTK
jgi:hypothetical protein